MLIAAAAGNTVLCSVTMTSGAKAVIAMLAGVGLTSLWSLTTTVGAKAVMAMLAAVGDTTFAFPTETTGVLPVTAMVAADGATVRLSLMETVGVDVLTAMPAPAGAATLWSLAVTVGVLPVTAMLVAAGESVLWSDTAMVGVWPVTATLAAAGAAVLLSETKMVGVDPVTEMDAAAGDRLAPDTIVGVEPVTATDAAAGVSLVPSTMVGVCPVIEMLAAPGLRVVESASPFTAMTTAPHVSVPVIVNAPGSSGDDAALEGFTADATNAAEVAVAFSTRLSVYPVGHAVTGPGGAESSAKRAAMKMVRCVADQPNVTPVALGVVELPVAMAEMAGAVPSFAHSAAGMLIAMWLDRSVVWVATGFPSPPTAIRYATVQMMPVAEALSSSSVAVAHVFEAAPESSPTMKMPISPAADDPARVTVEVVLLPVCCEVAVLIATAGRYATVSTDEPLLIVSVLPVVVVTSAGVESRRQYASTRPPDS